MRLLVGLGHVAETKLGPVPLLLADLPELALDVVRRLAAPDLEDDVDRLKRHPAAGHVVLEVEQLEVGRQAARPDAHQEAAVGQVIEHRGEASHHGRMLLRQVEHAGAEPDLLGQRDRLGEERERRGDRLGHRAEVLADPDVVEAQLVGVDHRLQILLEHLVVVLARRVQRHHEQAEPHRRLPPDHSPGYQGLKTDLASLRCGTQGSACGGRHLGRAAPAPWARGRALPEPALLPVSGKASSRRREVCQRRTEGVRSTPARRRSPFGGT